MPRSATIRLPARSNSTHSGFRRTALDAVRHPPVARRPSTGNRRRCTSLGINPKNAMHLSIGEDDVPLRIQRQTGRKPEGLWRRSGCQAADQYRDTHERHSQRHAAMDPFAHAIRCQGGFRILRCQDRASRSTKRTTGTMSDGMCGQHYKWLLTLAISLCARSRIISTRNHTPIAATKCFRV